jgi:predicted ferric reductase
MFLNYKFSCFFDIICIGELTMKKYINNYLKETDNLLNKKITISDIENHLNKINFFSHERLVHLIVTMFSGLFAILFLILTLLNSLFVYAFLLMMIVFIFYIFHYYFLENSIQKMYYQYDKMKEKIK